MNMQSLKTRSQKGFTLVEVIVVAIIVAALAAVAIPLYTSYVSSSRKNATANTAGSVASFCGACRNAAGTLTPALIAAGGGKIDCTAGGNTSSIQIPVEIKITYTAPVPPAPGVIAGEHKDDATATASYNF